MRFFPVLIALLASPALAQSPATPSAKSTTVPITLDHNRVIIDVYLPIPDGSTKRVRGWVDNGDPELTISQRAAKLMGLAVSCEADDCHAAPPQNILIGEMKIPLDGLKQLKVPLIPDADPSLMAPGMSAEIKIPSTVLRNYDVLINYPDREFSIGLPGTLHFKGVKSKMTVDPKGGLVQVASKLENKTYDFLLDIGAPVTFLSGDIFTRLTEAHPAWPRLTGAVGPANLWGGTDESKWQLMRVDRLQFGPLYLVSVPVIAWPEPWKKLFELHAEISPAAMLGADALMNYRVGLDYAHSIAYFDIGRTFNFPEFDVVGLILRPEADTHFAILGVAEIEGQPSVPAGDDGVQTGDLLVSVDNTPVSDSTMGQAWSLLEGSPGQERRLTIDRKGKQMTVVAKVQHFLAEPEETSSKDSRKKKK